MKDCSINSNRNQDNENVRDRFREGKRRCLKLHLRFLLYASREASDTKKKKNYINDDIQLSSLLYYNYCTWMYNHQIKKGLNYMSEIKRQNLGKECAAQYAYSEVVEAGDFVFLTFCVGNIGQSVEAQVHGALDNMAARLDLVGLTLESVVKVDIMMKDPWNIPIMEKVFKERFKGVYPARKTISTEFAERGGEEGRQVQIDAIAYKK